MSQIYLNKPRVNVTAKANAEAANKYLAIAKIGASSLVCPSGFSMEGAVRNIANKIDFYISKVKSLDNWLVESVVEFEKTDNNLMADLETIQMESKEGMFGLGGSDRALNFNSSMVSLFGLGMFGDDTLTRQQLEFESMYGTSSVNFFGHDNRFFNGSCTSATYGRTMYMYKQLLENGSITQEQYNKLVANLGATIAPPEQGNADLWAKNNREAEANGQVHFGHGDEPQKGAILVLDDPRPGKIGHVLFVEEIGPNGELYVSHGWGSEMKYHVIPAGDESLTERVRAALRVDYGDYYDSYVVDEFIYPTEIIDPNAHPTPMPNPTPSPAPEVPAPSVPQPDPAPAPAPTPNPAPAPEVPVPDIPQQDPTPAPNPNPEPPLVNPAPRPVPQDPIIGQAPVEGEANKIDNTINDTNK